MVTAVAPSDILSSPGPMSLISATMGLCHRRLATLPLLWLAVLGLETSASLGFLFWQGLATRNPLSQGRGGRGPPTAPVGPGKWASTFSSQPNHERPGDPSPPCPLWYEEGECFSPSKPFTPSLGLGPAVSPRLCPGLGEAPPSLRVIVLRVSPGTHRDRAATSPVLPGSLAPFPPYLPHVFPHHPPIPHIFLPRGCCPVPHSLFFLSASAISLPPRNLLGRLQTTQPDWAEFRTSEKKSDLLS